MSDNNRNNPNKNNQPPRYTGTNSDNFRLNLTDEDIAMGYTQPNRRPQNQNHAPAGSSKKIYYTEKERKQAEKDHKKRNKLKGKKNKRIFSLMWLLMVGFLGLTLASYLIVGADDFLAKNRETEAITTVTVPENVTEEQIGKIFEESGVINSSEFFTLYCKLRKKTKWFQAGTYEIATNLDYEALITELRRGEKREVVAVVIPEGYNALDIAKLLDKNGVCDSNEFLAELNNVDNYINYEAIGLLEDTDDKIYALEGYLFPDTYQFYKNEKVNTVIGKILNNFGNKIKDLKETIESSDMTLDEVITLASIIQKEAANKEDMYLVSAVLNNRLDFGEENGIKSLGCDSTEYYPFHTAADIPSNYSSDYVSNYSTRTNPGLPPGSICNPGLDAIDAALNPSDKGTTYLYFCHSEDGTAYYASTYDEHLSNLSLAGLTNDED